MLFVQRNKPAFLKVLSVLGGKSRVGLIANKEETMNRGGNLGKAAPLEREEKVRSMEGWVGGPAFGGYDEVPGLVREEHVAKRRAAQSNAAEPVNAVSTS